MVISASSSTNSWSKKSSIWKLDNCLSLYLLILELAIDLRLLMIEVRFDFRFLLISRSASVLFSSFLNAELKELVMDCIRLIYPTIFFGVVATIARKGLGWEGGFAGGVDIGMLVFSAGGGLLLNKSFDGLWEYPLCVWLLFQSDSIKSNFGPRFGVTGSTGLGAVVF